MEAWPSSRLVAALLLLVLLPPVRPGITLEELTAALAEGGVKATSKRAIFRLIADLRAAGFDLRGERIDGKTSYWLSGMGPDLLRRMGL